MDNELYEALAAIEHARWAGWQRYVHDVVGIRQPDGSIVIPADVVAHWDRQMNTAYADLSESEKQSDRQEVNRYWHLIADDDFEFPCRRVAPR